MTARDTLKMLKVRVTKFQLYACEYLEAQGLRFCIDFGYENAIQKATDHWLRQR